jgi:hypothetical protein
MRRLTRIAALVATSTRAATRRSWKGMPAGSPGMGDDPTKAFTVYAVTKDGGKPAVFAYE